MASFTFFHLSIETVLNTWNCIMADSTHLTNCIIGVCTYSNDPIRYKGGGRGQVCRSPHFPAAGAVCLLHFYYNRPRYVSYSKKNGRGRCVTICCVTYPCPTPLHFFFSKFFSFLFVPKRIADYYWTVVTASKVDSIIST